MFDAYSFRFLQVNRGARANLGYTLAELRALSPLDVKPQFSRETFEKLIEPLRDGSEQQIVLETVHRRKDGSEYDVEIYLQLIQSETPAVFVAIIQDISERKHADESLRAALVEAERANKAKSEFLATMSHEFRTPLNAILGFSEMMRAQYFGPLGSKNYNEYAKDIHDSGEHMLELVNDVLDIAAIEAGKRVIVKDDIDVEGLLNVCVRSAEKMAKNGGVKLAMETANGLPTLFADRRSSLQIVNNLISNAVKFTDQGGSVLVSAFANQDNIVIKVIDTGVGISPEQLPNITEPFVQADANPHFAQDGTGLGLSIVKSLVEAHDGTLTIESEVNEGTTVTVTLPGGQEAVVNQA